MDDERHLPGMPVLDRQPVRDDGRAPARPAGWDPSLPPSLQGLPPRSVPETRPTPLKDWFIYLSVIAFLAGAVAITAVEFGAPLGSPLVKLCVLVGAPPLALAMGDAMLRIWRSAWAWMPIDHGRGLVRLVWVAAVAILFLLLVGASVAVLTA